MGKAWTTSGLPKRMTWTNKNNATYERGEHALRNPRTVHTHAETVEKRWEQYANKPPPRVFAVLVFVNGR